MNFKNKILSIFAALLLIVAMPAWSWTTAGHQWITESAAMQLREKEQQGYDTLLRQGKLVPPKLFHSSVPIRLSALGVWPDKVRDIPLQELFEKYGTGTVPEALKPWANSSTSDWHYQNALFVDADGNAITDKAKQGKACKTVPSGELKNVWPELLKAFGQATDGADKNIVLALILHLAADAYQPLHLASALDDQCKSDRGGNKTCVLKSDKGKGCKQNLHQLWDQGFGIFESDRVWHKKLHPTNYLEFNNAEQLASAELANIYQADAAKYQTEEYRKAAQEIVYNNVGYAVGHTVFVLRYMPAQFK